MGGSRSFSPIAGEDGGLRSNNTLLIYRDAPEGKFFSVSLNVLLIESSSLYQAVIRTGPFFRCDC